MIKKLTLIALVLSYLLLIKTFSNVYIADIKYKNSENNLKSNLTTSLSNINEAIRLNPNEPEYLRQRAKIYTVTNNANLAYQDLQDAYNLNHNNIAIIRDNLPIYTALALISDSKAHKKLTQSYFEFVKNKYPNDVGTLADVAKYEKRLGLLEDYEKTQEQIKSLRPDILEWY